MTTAMPSSNNRAHFRAAYHQRGAALFISLMFLIILTLIGISAANVGIMQERMAGNVRETNEAFQGAEATLREVETAVRSSIEGTSTAQALEDLGVVKQWSELTAGSDPIIEDRSNCTLSQPLKANPAALDWRNAPDTGYEFTVYRASGSIGPGGMFFGSACSPLVSTGAVPSKEFDNVHVMVTRAPTRPGGLNMEVVSSIFNW